MTNRRTQLGREHVEALEWLPSQYQVKKHEGFSPSYVATRGDRDFHAEIEGARTPQLAKPPAWALLEDDQLTPCQDPRVTDKQIDTSDPVAAAALCAGCPVRQQCLAAALEEEGSLATGGRFLVRGGKTPAQRFRMYRDALIARGKSQNSSVTSEPSGRMQAAG